MAVGDGNGPRATSPDAFCATISAKGLGELIELDGADAGPESLGPGITEVGPGTVIRPRFASSPGLGHSPSTPPPRPPLESLSITPSTPPPRPTSPSTPGYLGTLGTSGTPTSAATPTTVESVAAAWASRENTVFARQFVIHRTVGTGGMGMVYDAMRISDGRRVALKVIHRHLVSNQQVTRRFLREAVILGTLRGSNLVPLIESGDDGEGRLFMALEFVEGEALDQTLSRRGPLPLDEAVDIVIQLCDALVAAHSLGVVHRDLKPANILLEPIESGKKRVRVFDFGLAKVLRESGITTSHLTEQHMVFGTPEYMAPEQVKGDEPDARCDIYAAGVILYELLTGRVPFCESTGVATMTAHLTGTLIPPRLRAGERSISAALEAVTLYAMARSPEGRYPSAATLRDALVRAQREPHGVSSMRPPPQADIATVDTLMQRSPTSSTSGTSTKSGTSGKSGKTTGGIDPLGATAPFVAPDPRLPSSAPPARVRVATTQPSPLAGARTSDPPGALGRVTPEQLRGSEPKPWLWLIVAIVAAAIGIAVGILVAT